MPTPSKSIGRRILDSVFRVDRVSVEIPELGPIQQAPPGVATLRCASCGGSGAAFGAQCEVCRGHGRFRPPVEYLNDLVALPPLCSGKQTGYQCRHYWLIVEGEPDVKTIDRIGGDPTRVRRQRHCMLTGDAEDLGMNGARQAKTCDFYRPEVTRPYYVQLEECKLKAHTVPAGVGVTDEHIDQMANLNIAGMLAGVKQSVEAAARAEQERQAATGETTKVTITVPPTGAYTAPEKDPK